MRIIFVKQHFHSQVIEENGKHPIILLMSIPLKK